MRAEDAEQQRQWDMHMIESDPIWVEPEFSGCVDDLITQLFPGRMVETITRAQWTLVKAHFREDHGT
jgi:hypothetical protein